MNNAPQLEDGTTIGPYRVESLLGRGGMAEVYKVRHLGLQREEALKLLPAAASHDANFVGRFLKEARLAAGLHHPHIVTTYSVSEGDGPPFYFSMQLIEGGDLADLIHARHRIAPRATLPILRQIAAALDYAHARGVIHRDIKPGNILLESDDPLAVHRPDEFETIWNTKVVDFGIARALAEGADTRLTQGGMFVGTPEYMSPEQAGSGAPVDKATDLYALGIVAYEMLCGRPPFRASKDTSPLSVMVKHLNEAPPAPRQWFPELPIAANEVLLRALAKDPSHRFVSCIAFVEALAATTAAMEVSSAPPSPISQLASAAPLPKPRDSQPRAPIAPTAVAPLAERARAQENLPPENTPQTSTPIETAVAPPEVASENVAAETTAEKTDDEKLQVEKPTPENPAPRAPLKASTLNRSLYSLFNETEKTASAAPASAFDFPTAPAPTPSTPRASELKSPALIENASTPAAPRQASTQTPPIDTPPVEKPRAEKRRAQPMMPLVAALAALCGLVLLGLGWKRSTQPTPAPTPQPTAQPTAAPQPKPTSAPRAKPAVAKPVIKKPAVKITSRPKISTPRKPVTPSVAVHRPVVRRSIIRRAIVHHAPRVESSLPRRVHVVPHIKRTVRPRAPHVIRARPTHPKLPHAIRAPSHAPDAY